MANSKPRGLLKYFEGDSDTDSDSEHLFEPSEAIEEDEKQEQEEMEDELKEMEEQEVEEQEDDEQELKEQEDEEQEGEEQEDEEQDEAPSPKRSKPISYFLSNEDRSPRFVRLAKQFEDPFTEVHLLFHLSVLQLFVRVNKVMQLESPLIPFLDGLLHDFLAKFCCRFLNVSKVKEAGPVHIDPEDDAVKMSNDKLDIGFTTKALVKNLVDGGCDMREVSKFYAAVCAFYKQGLLYARSRLLQIQC